MNATHRRSAPPVGARARGRRPAIGSSALAALADVVDPLLELTVAGSFSRIGYLVRSRLERWGEPEALAGKAFVVTGASSGIGRASAIGLARLGAQVWLVGRDPERTAEAASAASQASAGSAAHEVTLDVNDAPAVAGFAEQLAASTGRLDGIVHCAGALYPAYRQAPDGTELTVATHVLAPFRLTWLISPLLRAAGDATVVILSSGGMYTERFDLDRLEMGPEEYQGVRAYARAKRAQVVLSHEWARRWAADGLASYAAHPGWVDTPALAAGLPSFSRRLGPLLRRPEEGADTVVWLAAGGARQASDPRRPSRRQGFFHDRHLRGEHHLPGTRPRWDGAGEGGSLWAWCQARTGLG